MHTNLNLTRIAYFFGLLNFILFLKSCTVLELARKKYASLVKNGKFTAHYSFKIL